FGEVAVAARFDTRLVRRTTIGIRVPDRERNFLVGVQLLVPLDRGHVHLDERGIGDLVLEGHAIADPAETADEAIGQAPDAAYPMNLAIHTVARPRVPDDLPGCTLAKRGSLTLVETHNG